MTAHEYTQLILREFLENNIIKENNYITWRDKREKQIEKIVTRIMEEYKQHGMEIIEEIESEIGR